MCSSGEPVPHTSSIHPKQHLHTFQQSPLAQLSIYTAMLFQQPSYTYAVPCWLSCKPWCSQREVKGTQVAAPAPPVCNSSLNSPSTAACCDFSSLRGPDIRYFYMSFFFFWIVYPFPTYHSSPVPSLHWSCQQLPAKPRACSAAAVSIQPCGPSQDGISPSLTLSLLLQLFN